MTAGRRAVHRARLAVWGILWVAALAAGACRYNNQPANGAQACAALPGQQCPDGYHCASDDRCWQNGHEPVADAGGQNDGAPPDTPGTDRGADGSGDTRADGLANPDTGCATSMHLCSNVCVSRSSVDHCGQSCDACTPPAGGTATCDGTQCGFDCTGVLKKCGAKCVAGCCVDLDCLPQNGKMGQCDTSTNMCSYQDCAAGNKPCGTACIPMATCCSANDCIGTCQTCSGPGGTCTAVMNQDDADSCPGTCDAAGTCKSRRGQTCGTTAGGCIAGTTCAPDGYCCNTACGAPCQACDILGFEGTCTPVAAGGPHGNRTPCAGGATTCGGSCMGNLDGSCFYPTTSCGSGPTCSGSSVIPQGACSNGACVTPAPVTCANGFVCSVTACRTNCTVNSDCQANYFCRSGACRLKAMKVAAGSGHTCVLLVDGSIRCWGSNSVGQLGDGNTRGFADPDVLLPVTVIGFGASRPATAISLGYSYSCAITGGNVWCWGSNQYGELANGSILNTAPFGIGTPAPITGVTSGLTATALGAGQVTGCALLSNAGIWCWGYNGNGELGRGTYTPSPFGIPSAGPVGSPSPITGFVQLALTPATSSACGVFSGGSTSCWGFNSSGELGGGFTSFNPSGVAGLVGVSGLPAGTLTSFVSVGNGFSCAVQSDHTAWCWGLNYDGQMGTGALNPDPVLTPQRVSATALPPSPAVTALGCGFYHSCVLITGNVVKCWGNNFYGQLGNGGLVSPNPTPTAVPGLPTGDPITSMSVGVTHTCVLLTSGAVWCWGRNDDGQLGNNSKATSPVPVQVGAW